jgi:hypothetical protein
LVLRFRLSPLFWLPVPNEPPPVPNDPPPVPSDPPPVPNELPVPMPVVDELPADPDIDEAPIEPAEEPPAAPPFPAPAAKAQLPDAAKPAAKISVVIFMDILLRCWTKDKTRRGGTFRPIRQAGREISSTETGERERWRLPLAAGWWRNLSSVMTLFCRKTAPARPAFDF